MRSFCNAPTMRKRPERERGSLRATVGEIFCGVDGVSDIPFPVRCSLDQSHRRERAVNRLALDEARVCMKFSTIPDKRRVISISFP